MAAPLSILNARPRKLAGPSLLHQLLPQDVDDNRIAIDYLSSSGTAERVSYNQLHHRADHLARRLRAAWAGTTLPNDVHIIAPIFIPQCPHLYISQLAALQAGAAFCPISTDVPEERLRFILDDVDARVLITTSQLKATLPDLGDVQIITVDEQTPDVDDNDVPSVDGDDCSIDIKPSQPAYVMYTSGSTGQPKGVVLSHSSATQALLAHDGHIPQFDRFLQFASPTFDVSVFEIFFPLFRGCTLVSGERRLMLNDLPHFITRMNVDAAELTPSVASSLLQGRKSVPTLKLLLTIGEMLKQDIVEEFGGSPAEDGILHGMYGPTEATIHCTLQTPFSKTSSVCNIGVPLATVSAFVLSTSPSSDSGTTELEIRPTGEEGELAVGGYQLADGYLNRSEETKAAFVHHPEYGMLYRTGDRARLTSSGTLECLGRISHGQVKLRGQRIELGEVEYAALKTPGLVSVVADVIDNCLIVFCVSKTRTTELNVRHTCGDWLPAFMVPKDVVLLHQLPYLDSGKVDRKALKAIYAERKQPTTAQTNAALSPNGHRIVEVISSILETSIDIDTPLASSGLDSLSAIRIASRLRREGFPQLDAAALLDARNIADVERLVKTSEQSQTTDDLQNGETVSRLHDAVSRHPATSQRLHEVEEIYPLTPVQLAMLSETAKNGQAYCNWIELSVAGHGIDEIRKALVELARNHSLLRGGFLSTGEVDTNYALIIWKNFTAEQIRQTDSFDRQFRVTSDDDLLHPCSFQLIESKNEVRILLQIHHSLYDQWSIDILRADLSVLLHGRDLHPRPAFHQISRYQETNRSATYSEDGAEFWQNILRDFSLASLPLMNGKKTTRNLLRTPWHDLGVDLSAIKIKSRSLGIGAHVVFQAAMTYLLGCYTGSTDVTYGMVFSGRNLPIAGIESIFGPCLTTLPLRVDYSTTRTRSDMLRLIQQRNRGIQKKTLMPLTEIQQSSDALPGTRLFDTLFVWQETSLTADDDAGVVTEIESADHHEFELVLEFQPSANGLQAKATYQQALMTLNQIELLLQQATAIVHEILEEPNGLVKDLATGLPQEMLSVANFPPVPCADTCNLLDAIQGHTAQPSELPAIAFADSIAGEQADVQSITFRELDERSNRMANFLRSLNVLPDDLVCICMEKSPNMYISILATFKAGAGYVPLIPETPPSRLRSILNQSRVKVCLCDSKSLSTFQDLEVQTAVNIETLDLSRWDGDALGSRADGSHVAYVVFTSGSTGEPKGVAVTRDNLLGNLESLKQLYDTQPGDRLLQACSQAFDVSVFEIFFAFYTGMCLCSAKPSDLFYDLEAAIRALRISHLSLTPTVAALIDPKSVPEVRFLVTAGEGVTDLVHRSWAGKGLHQGYGPSETTNICTVNMRMAPDDTINNIGPPFQNTSAFVIAPGSHFDILPAGSFGEFVFGGEQVFRGYINADALNAKQIVDHSQYGRLYKSGDLGRILHDGTLLIGGRLDGQVKVRGNRVELGEISSVLLNDSSIHDCATLLVGRDATEQSLAAFIVPEDCQTNGSGRSELTTLESDQTTWLFELLTDSVPYYMLPDFIIPVTKLPLTTQGKLDKRHLLSLFERLSHEARQPFSRGGDTSEDLADWNDEERRIAEALRECLDLPPSARIARNQSFFSIGLNSLNAMAFAKLASARLQTRVDVPTVLRSSTIARLARVLGSKAASPADHSKVVATHLLPPGLVEEVQTSCESWQDDIECILPCTPLQTAMLSGSLSTSGSAYCNSLVLRVSGSVDELKRCWEYMVGRHSILRTQFVETSDREHPFVQVVVKDLMLPWREKNVKEQAPIVDAVKPFAIEIQNSLQGTALILHMHHAVYDGISMSRLLEEVEMAYREEELPPTPSFIPFLAEAQIQAGGEAIGYWEKVVEGYTPKPFPHLLSPNSQEELKVEASVTASRADIESYCKKYALSPLAVFQTALAKVLMLCQRVQDVCFGNVVSGRTVPVEGVEALVAPCFNTVPVRVNLIKSTTNLELAQQLSTGNKSMLRYQLTPLRRIQHFSQSPSKKLYDCLLIFQPQPHELDRGIWSVEEDTGGMGLPLVFEVTPRGDSYTLLLHVSQAYSSSAFAEKLMLAFDSALLSCINYPESSSNYFESFDDATIGGSLVSEVIGETEEQGQDTNPDESWTSHESAVRKAFAFLSGVPESDIGKQTLMYQLGLDSLNAPQVAHRLRSIGYDVDAADVMESPTPSQLAVTIEQKAASSGSRKPSGVDLDAFDKSWRDTVLSTTGLSDASIEAVRPCTAVQSGMLSQSLNSEGRLYVNHVTYEIPESTSQASVAELHHAWAAVRDHHQMLRVGFHRLENCPSPFIMVIQRAETIPLRLVEIAREKSIVEIEEQASAYILESSFTNPWQVTVQTLSDARRMTLSLHHALYDAESLHIILSDLHKVLSYHQLGPELSIDPALSSLLAAETDRDGHSADFWKVALEQANFSKFPDLNPNVVTAGQLKSKDHTGTLPLSTLEECCREYGVTIQALGQATWARVLAAYTGEEHVTFGTVFASRALCACENVAFPCISTIPVSCVTTVSDSDLLQHMVEFNASAQKHRLTPLSDIQRFASLSSQALFDTVFVYQKLSAQHNELKWPVIHETAAVDYIASLELEANKNDEVRMRLTFDTGRIPPQHASLILQQYDHLLSLMVAGNVETPDLDASLSILPAKESSLPSEHHLLHHRVELGALNHPDRPALHFVSGSEIAKASMKTWTFRQLNDVSNQVANLIRTMGVDSESIIAVSMDKRPEASFAFIGILKAGCSFLAVDPALPENRLAFILEDSKAQILFGDKEESTASIPNGTRYFNLTMRSLERLPTSPVSDVGVSASATCYCLYTSGTTGTPKGCEITHENAVQAMLAFERLFAGRWKEHSRWLQFASYWFDVSVLEHFWSWGVGIAVVGASRDLVLEDISGFIREFSITHIDLTPSLARLVHPSDVPSLWDGVFITGGEALKQEIIDLWGPKLTICNGYGPTECTIGVTMNTFIDSDAKPSNIGRQFDNVGTYVLSPKSDEVVLRGAVGELCVSGTLVGKGYLNRPDLSAQQFPTLHRYGERVYRTGDLVRMLADGSFTFIGRKDTQTKLRGQRLEIAEIDNVIQQSNNEITNVVSMVVSSSEGQKEVLVSFIAAGASGKTQELQLDSPENSKAHVKAAKNACIRALPSYMIPTHIVPINSMPLTVNNKLDTKRLVALFNSFSVKELQSLQDGGQNAEPLNGVEEKIRAVLCEMLPMACDDVQKSANLFSLGLSSISAISFATRLKRAGFRGASPAIVMRNPTLEMLGDTLASLASKPHQEMSVKQAELATAAFTHRHLYSAAQALSVPSNAIEAVVPCTPLQQGMIVDSMRGDSASYFNDFRYDVSDIDVGVLRTALQTLVSGLQILRSRFIGTNEGHIQVILQDQQFDIIETKQSAKNVDGFVQETKRRWIDHNASELMSPLQIHVVRTDSRCFMIVLIHHALYDGTSYDLMLALLARIYKSERPYDFGPDFSTAISHGPFHSVTGAAKFWIERYNYSGSAPLKVISDSPDIATRMLTFDLGDVDSFESVRKTLGVSHQALLQGCFELALCASQPSIQTYGLVVSGRSIPLDGADRVFGPMFNTLPYSLRVKQSSKINEHIQRCHEMNVDAIPFQHTPLRDIRKWCGQPSSEAMFDVVFIFQHNQINALAEAEQLFQPVETAPRADYPLECEIELTEDGKLNATFLAQSRYFSQDDLGAFRKNLQKAFESVRKGRDLAIEDIFGTSIGEQRETPRLQNGTSPDLNGVHGLEWTEAANNIRYVLAEVGGVEADDIDEHSSIFALGLDSIDAVKLASRLKNVGLSIPVSKLLQAQTIPRILQAASKTNYEGNANTRLRELQNTEEKLRNAPLPGLQSKYELERVLPATPGQEALLAEMIRTGLEEYYNHDVLSVRSTTDLSRLQTAWQSVVDTTPILRTSFFEVTDPSIDIVFAQAIHSKLTLRFDEYDIKDTEELDTILDKIRQDVAADSQMIQPLRVSIVNSHSEKYLVLSLAHAQYDGYSLAMLHEDVHNAYNGKTISRPMYDKAIEDALNASQDTQTYWTGLLAGARPQAFPLRDSHADVPKTHRKQITGTVSASDSRTFCQSQNISMQALAETCWSIALAQYTKCFDVRFGVVLACRDSEEAEHVMFPLMNTVPMRASLHGSRAQMLRYVQSIITERAQHQRTPLRYIQSVVQTTVGPQDETSDVGLFDTLFIYQRRPLALEDVPRLYESVGGSSNVEYPVAVEMEAVGERLILRAACKDNALDEAGTATLLETLNEVLQAITTSPDKPTVDFAGERVSICGLSPFAAMSPQSKRNVSPTNTVIPESPVDPEDAFTTSRIVEAMAEVSKAKPEEVSPDSTIESIGIDSISAIKVAAMLRKQSINLTVSEIIKARTAARMAGLLSAKEPRSPVAKLLAKDLVAASVEKYNPSDLATKLGVDAGNIEEVLPATAGQTYMLSMWLKSRGQLFYSTFEYQSNTHLSREQVEQTWRVLVDRHSILRTVFCSTGDFDTPLVQVVLKEPISAATPLMVSLDMEQQSSGYLLNLTIHHALYDAVSLLHLMHDFQSLLERSAGTRSTVKFEDFLALALGSEVAKTQQAFWTQYLRPAEQTHLLQPKYESPGKRVEIFESVLFDGMVELDGQARKASISIQSLLFAAYAKVYASLAPQTSGEKEDARPDVVLGIYLSNRSHLPGLDTLLGPTLNLVPLLVRAVREISILDLAAQIHADLGQISSAANSAVGLWKVHEWSGVKVDTFVNFLKLPEQDEETDTPDAVIKPLDDRRSRDRRGIVEPPDVAFEAPSALEDLQVVETYQHSVDIEMTVRDGKLGVGFFCPETMVNLDTANVALQELKNILESIVGKARE